MILKRFFHIKKILKPRQPSLPPAKLIADPHKVTDKTWDLDLSSSMQLPIYRNYKRGIPITTVRKIIGSVDVSIVL